MSKKVFEGWISPGLPKEFFWWDNHNRLVFNGGVHKQGHSQGSKKVTITVETNEFEPAGPDAYDGMEP